MRGLACGAIAAGLLYASTGVQAESVTRTYQAVMHVTHAETMEVLDEPGHVVGIAQFRGLALFDGEPMEHRYAGWFETVDGVGDFRGTARWELPDGTLEARYHGTLDERAADDFEFEAEFSEFFGTGAYLDASGEGRFRGRRMAEVSKGGTTYLEGTITLELEP